MLDPKNVKPGNEQFEEFYPQRGTRHFESDKRVQYDYRSVDGELFSCVARTLAHARDRRDAWLKSREYAKLQTAIATELTQPEPHTAGLDWASGMLAREIEEGEL